MLCFFFHFLPLEGSWASRRWAGRTSPVRWSRPEITPCRRLTVGFAILTLEVFQIVHKADTNIAAQNIGCHVLNIVFADNPRETFILIQNVVDLNVDLTPLILEKFLSDAALSRKYSSVNLSVTPRYFI